MWKGPASDVEDGGLRLAGPAGSGCPVSTSRQPGRCRGVVVVRDAAEWVEQVVGRRWEGPVGVVMSHARFVTEGAAEREGGGSVGGPWLRHARTAPCSAWRIGASLSHAVGDNPEDLGGDLVALALIDARV